MYYDWTDYLVGAMMTLLVVLLIGSIVAIVIYGKECEAKGGKMVGDGTYTTTVTVVNGVGIANTSENKTCSVK